MSDNMITYSYIIDENDCIVSVDDNWLQFAQDNQAKELNTNKVISRSLWQFVTDHQTIHLYKMLVAQVRAKRKPVSVPFRCDSPYLRRYMVIKITPHKNGDIQLTSKLVKTEERSYVPLLDSSLPRSNEVLMICSWCKNIRISETEWAEAEEAIQKLGLFEKENLPMLSHGMCPACFEQWEADFEAEISLT